MAETAHLNGVDVGVVQDPVKAIEGDPGLGSGTFRLDNRWVNVGHNRASINGCHGHRPVNEYVEKPQRSSNDRVPGNDI